MKIPFKIVMKCDLAVTFTHVSYHHTSDILIVDVQIVSKEVELRPLPFGGIFETIREGRI